MQEEALRPQRDRATRYVSLDLVHCCAAIGTSCTTNPQLIAVMELEANGWPTCSKQSPCVDRRRCRQQTRPSTSFCWQRHRLAVAGILKCWVWDEVPEKSTLILKILKFPYNTGGRSHHAKNQFDSSSHFDTILYRRWWRGTMVERRSLAGELSVVLRLTCSWWVTTNVGKPSATGQPTRPTQPFILSGSINE